MAHLDEGIGSTSHTVYWRVYEDGCLMLMAITWGIMTILKAERMLMMQLLLADQHFEQ